MEALKEGETRWVLLPFGAHSSPLHSGTTIAVTFAEGSPTNVVSKKVIDTKNPKDTLALVREE